MRFSAKSHRRFPLFCHGRNVRFCLFGGRCAAAVRCARDNEDVFTAGRTVPEHFAHKRDGAPPDLFEFLRHFPHEGHLSVPHEQEHFIKRFLDAVR